MHQTHPQSSTADMPTEGHAHRGTPPPGRDMPAGGHAYWGTTREILQLNTVLKKFQTLFVWFNVISYYRTVMRKQMSKSNKQIWNMTLKWCKQQVYCLQNQKILLLTHSSLVLFSPRSHTWMNSWCWIASSWACLEWRLCFRLAAGYGDDYG